MRKQYWFLPLEWQNFYIWKDVCQVPLQIQKEFWYETTLIFIWKYFPDEIPYCEYNWMKIIILNNYFQMLLFILRDFYKINLFWTFHFHTKSLFILLIYRLLNWKWKIILKSDISHNSVLQLIWFTKNKFKCSIINFILTIIDVFTVESKRNIDILKTTFLKHSDKFVLVSNWFNWDDSINFNGSFKENNIVVIWHIWDKNKNHELLIESLKNIQFKNKWNLYFIWKVFNDFDKKINNKNNNLNIIFTWPIYEKKYLYELLNKSKIFCHTSNYEWDPLVQYEAMYYWLYCVSTDCWTIKENYPSFFSKISNIGDEKNYTINLQETIDYFNNNEYIIDSEKCNNYCIENFLWNKATLNLINIIKWQK